MKKYLNSTYIIYFLFFVMLISAVFAKNIHIEPGDMGWIGQILHPEYPKGGLSYNPIYHYNYIVAFTAERFGLNNDSIALARIFWFLEMSLAVFILVKLCNFVFRDDKTVLVLAIMMFILLKSGETDQKTMVKPIYFLAIYYFLKEKWLISAFFGGLIFYLHVGLAIWWFLPSCFALTIISLIQKRISLKQIIKYALVIIAVASPILYFYFGRVQTSEVDVFSIKYYYYTCWANSAVLIALSNMGWVVSLLLMVGVFLMGYYKAKKSGYKNNNIMSIVIGVLILYFVNFIFADILKNSTVITLQLLRSMVYVELFSALFFAFLLAKQIKKGNYIFFFIFLLLAFKYDRMKQWLGNVEYYDALNAFYLILLIYEIFEEYIVHFIEKMYKTFEGKLNVDRFRKIVGKSNRFVQRPVVIASFLVIVFAPKPPPIKSYIKSILRIPHSDAIVRTAREYLYKDVVRFTNRKMTDPNIFLLVPFYESDFEYYTKHKTFITYATPLFDIQRSDESTMFRRILEDDLKCSVEELFRNHNDEKFRNKWREMWKTLSESTIRHWKKKYRLTHVIREKDLPLKFPVLYQNEFYVIYEIK